MFKPHDEQLHDEMLHDDMEQKMEAGLTPELPGDAEFDEAAYDEGALLGADLAKLLAEEKELLEMLSAPADFAARIEAAVAAADAAEAAAAPAPQAEAAPQQPTKVYVPKKKKSPFKMLASLAAVAVLAIGLIGFGGGLFQNRAQTGSHIAPRKGGGRSCPRQSDEQTTGGRQRNSSTGEKTGGGSAFFGKQPQQKMLRADIGVPQLLGKGKGTIQHRRGGGRKVIHK